MVAVIALSGDPSPKPVATQSQKPAPVIDPNAARIAEYRNRIEEQARKLAAEQAALAQTKAQTGAGELTTQTLATQSAVPSVAPTPIDERLIERRRLESEKEKRDYQSLFSSNLALTFRDDTINSVPPPGPSQRGGSHQGAAVPTGDGTHVDRAPQAEREDSPSTKSAEGKEYRLFEGTLIETVLTNRLSGSLAGPVNCMVTTAVYSHDRQHLLIPQGSRVLGEVKPVNSFGQQRLAVGFHRLIMPDGYSLSLDQFRGLNQIGETGLRDKVNNHYLQVFGASIAIGAIAGLAQANTRSGFDSSSEDSYRQGMSSSLSQSALRILDRYLNILPTFTVREGHRIKIYLADDLTLPAYSRHKMASDL